MRCGGAGKAKIRATCSNRLRWVAFSARRRSSASLALVIACFTTSALLPRFGTWIDTLRSAFTDRASASQPSSSTASLSNSNGGGVRSS